MMLRRRFIDGSWQQKGFIKIDWDARTFIMQHESWETAKFVSSLYPEDLILFVTDELWEWLPDN